MFRYVDVLSLPQYIISALFFITATLLILVAGLLRLAFLVKERSAGETNVYTAGFWAIGTSFCFASTILLGLRAEQLLFTAVLSGLFFLFFVCVVIFHPKTTRCLSRITRTAHPVAAHSQPLQWSQTGSPSATTSAATTTPPSHSMTMLGISPAVLVAAAVIDIRTDSGFYRSLSIAAGIVAGLVSNIFAVVYFVPVLFQMYLNHKVARWDVWHAVAVVLITVLLLVGVVIGTPLSLDEFVFYCIIQSPFVSFVVVSMAIEIAVLAVAINIKSRHAVPVAKLEVAPLRKYATRLEEFVSIARGFYDAGLVHGVDLRGLQTDVQTQTEHVVALASLAHSIAELDTIADRRRVLDELCELGQAVLSVEARIETLRDLEVWSARPPIPSVEAELVLASNSHTSLVTQVSTLMTTAFNLNETNCQLSFKVRDIQRIISAGQVFARDDVQVWLSERAAVERAEALIQAGDLTGAQRMASDYDTIKIFTDVGASA
ncbi:hypothetical protein J8273_1626 [Carpediemonas membranifera]|uniref:Uncharacterized protein n=1 Tax=Carpediemonas membranifera TaxID=201153 RepID=A0A8J6E1P1_9EUKA|nr:hypothetical protein J8273_1626 [Carpediemonas membranifera]|eukprot:KAG9396609.1 hypothetical protein J8273_1626 [Carpediemonas membranifera]